MDGRWVSLREAAVTLGVSVRTLQRRIKRGEMEARETPDGRREVLIETPATKDDITRDTLSMLQEQNERGILIAGRAAALAKEQADNYRLEMENTRTELRVARRGGRVAWAVVGAFLVCAGVVAWLAAQALTKQSAQIETYERDSAALRGALSDAKGDLAQRRKELEATRTELAQARADTKAQERLVEVLRDDRDKMRQDVAIARQAATEAREKAARAEERIATLEAALEAAKEEAQTRPSSTTRPAGSSQE